MYTSKLVNPIIQDPPIEIGGLKEKVLLGLVSLNSNVSWGFVSLFNKRLTVLSYSK